MSIFKEKFKQLKDELTLKKENIRPFLLSVGITLFFFIGYQLLGNHFGEVMGMFTMILFALMLVIFVIIAEFTVLKSFFLVAAELSLLIFLAKSYCDVPNRSAVGNEALKNLLTIGLFYIAVTFGRSLWKAIKEHYKKVEKERWSKEKILAIALFLIFTVFFIGQIYSVIKPIILNLCIYKGI